MTAVAVTFTGADASTSSYDLAEIAAASADLGLPTEVGVLLSFERAGSERYPGAAAAVRILAEAAELGLGVALHACGVAASELASASLRFAGFAEWLPALRIAAEQGRVQVNLPPARSTPAALQAARAALLPLCGDRSGGPRTVGQHRAGRWPAPAQGAEWLLDRSEGKGLAAAAWPPLPPWRVGLAGGIGPRRDPAASSAGAAARALLASEAGGWLDMESRVRRGGRLCPNLCAEVLAEVSASVARAKAA